jgi:hypothetical protein
MIEVRLRLSEDTPNSMNFEDTYAGLDNIWYKFDTDARGSVSLSANADGFEHLARFFLKMARGGKQNGYHSHHPLEFGKDQYAQGRELTIAFLENPEEAQ